MAQRRAPTGAAATIAPRAIAVPKTRHAPPSRAAPKRPTPGLGVARTKLALRLSRRMGRFPKLGTTAWWKTARASVDFELLGGRCSRQLGTHSHAFASQCLSRLHVTPPSCDHRHKRCWRSNRRAEPPRLPANSPVRVALEKRKGKLARRPAGRRRNKHDRACTIKLTKARGCGH